MKNQLLPQPELKLEIIDTTITQTIETPSDTRGLEASLLALSDAEFAAIAVPGARCSSTAGGGAAPYGAKWYEYFCPAFGEA